MTGFKDAFALSRDAVRLARPLGTIQLTDYTQPLDDGRPLRYPRPSSDPMDPLNWPSERKIASLVCMSVYGFLANFASASIASAFPLLATPLAFNPPKPIGDLTHLISVNVLMLGAVNLLWVPLANIFGRRPVILLSTLLHTVFSIWAATTTSFNSLLAARLFAGAPADTVAPNVVGEIFSTYQRGRAMGLYTVLLALGPLVGGLAGGYIAGNLGIPWVNWINVILSGSLFTACFFFQPETLFSRDDDQPSDVAEPSVGVEKLESTQEVENVPPSRPHPQGFSYPRSLRVGLYRSGFRKQLVRPFLTLRLPGVWLVMFWYAGLVAGVVAVSTVSPAIMASPPYLWGANSGCINVGGIVGVLLGFTMTAVLSDRVISWQSTRSTNTYIEAEVRLPLAIPGLFLATAGLWTFGFCANNPSKYMWIGMEFGLGMLSFGLILVPSIGFNYIIEAYGHLAPDAFVAIATLRAIISFCWTFFVGHWVMDAGTAVPFGVFGALMGYLFSALNSSSALWQADADCNREVDSLTTESSFQGTQL